MQDLRLCALLRAAAMAEGSPQPQRGAGLTARYDRALRSPRKVPLALHQVPQPEPSPTGDAEFRRVRAFLLGDRDATAWMAERLTVVPRILGALCRRFGFPLQHDEIADVAQDAVAIALRKLDQLTANVPLDAWLHRLCSYELCNAVRRRQRQRTSSLDEQPMPATTSAIDAVDRREVVQRALEQLRPDEAAALRMHHLEGLTFTEIASRLGVSANTVKGRYYRGIAQLSVTMRHHHPSRSAP